MAEHMDDEIIADIEKAILPFKMSRQLGKDQLTAAQAKKLAGDTSEEK